MKRFIQKALIRIISIISYDPFMICGAACIFTYLGGVIVLKQLFNIEYFPIISEEYPGISTDFSFFYGVVGFFVALFFYIIISKKSYMEYIPGQMLTCGNNSYYKIIAFSDGELACVDIDHPLYVGKREYKSYFIITSRCSNSLEIADEEKPFGPMVLDMKGYIGNSSIPIVIDKKRMKFKELYEKIKNGNFHTEQYFDREVAVVV